ncbi:MAG TPA: sigma-54 dependent transcriptional regulator [Polyangiaceae bacterium]|jgi:two-component system response regulator HydG|nr:sigma-54 dependent transcriptional regulator [Polyangiaceae bacterium]
MQGSVLFVDDDQSMCDLVETALSKRGFKVLARTSADEAMLSVGTDDFDVVVTDLNMTGMSGLDLCRRIVENRPDVPVVVVTAFGSMEAAVAAIRAGAYDFITKPFQMDELGFTIGRAVQHRSLREEVKRLRRAAAASSQFGEMVGASPAMRKVYELLERVADTDATVLITGESGTGKELVAKALHRRGRRGNGPFVAVNCAAVPEPILESELFGHMKGAFTDAKTGRTGLFLQASSGTLFLDEIGEMPLGMQVKLLRALQERKVRPVGGEQEIAFDARIVAATNRDLESEVAEHKFREDLYYRINVVRVQVPPLRARGNDVLLLAQNFVERFAAQNNKKVVGLSSPAAEKLLAYEWPGNVRELQNCIERAVALTQFEQITVEDLPDKVRNYRSNRLVVATEDPSELLTMEEVERRYILKVLQTVGGNKTLAAQVLGFDRRTLYRKLERYGAAEANAEES